MAQALLPVCSAWEASALDTGKSACATPRITSFYEGELWKRELENVLMPMLEKYEVVVVEDPEGLVRW